MTRATPIALTIAGSDSGGGAGIQADLKTFHGHGVYGTSVLTAVTAQNTVGVAAVHDVPVPVVRAQIDAVVSDLPPAAVKTGMLASAELVTAIAEEIAARGLPSYVLDPVMVATSGDRLLAVDAETCVAERLLPLSTIVTPNLHEAGILTRARVTDLEGMKAAARRLVEAGAGSALVKGGHLRGQVADVFFDGAVEHVWRRPRIETRHTHGTGCTLSASICARLALGHPLLEAVRGAVDWLHRAIASAPGLGAGHGPVNHFEPSD